MPTAQSAVASIHSSPSEPSAAASSTRASRPFEQRQHDLRFRIAKPHVELDDLRPVGREHQADVEKPACTDRLPRACRRAPAGRSRSITDAISCGVDERTRRERAHPARVRSPIVVEHALVILRGAERNRRGAVRQEEERHFRTGEALLDHQPRARRRRTAARPSPRARPPRPPRDPRRRRRPCPPARPSALTTTGNPKSRPDTASSARSSESQTTNRAVGIPCRAMKSLANTFEHSSAARARRRPDDWPAGLPEQVGDAALERRLGPDDGRDRRLRVLGEGQHAVQGGRDRWRRSARSPPCRDCRGRRSDAVTSGSRLSRQASACSRPPLPRTRTRIGLADCRLSRTCLTYACWPAPQRAGWQGRNPPGEGVSSLGRSEDSGRRVD